MKIPLYLIDAFADKLFAGNPAAVCPLESWPDEALMQSIAAENNLSETAFFVPSAEGFDLRWFTPKSEVDLCGHATLASAYVIFSYLNYAEEVHFQTKSGLLRVARGGDLLSMDFPARKPEPADAAPELAAGLGVEPVEVWRSRDYMAVFQREQDVRDVQPDFEELSQLDSLGVIVTAPGDDVDFVSRFFAPRVGIPEDPVTGSAHSTLIPYWADRLGKNSLHALQLSERGGELFCEDRGDRVFIAGKAVTYAIGAIQI